MGMRQSRCVDGCTDKRVWFDGAETETETARRDYENRETNVLRVTFETSNNKRPFFTEGRDTEEGMGGQGVKVGGSTPGYVWS